MKKIITAAARHPWLVLFLLVVITAVALTRLPDLRVEIKAEGMMVDNPPAIAQYERTMETFGSENVTVVYLEDPNLFEPDNLKAIRLVLRAIEAIPQVVRTVSLFSVRYIRTVDGYIYTTPYLEEIPKTGESAKEVVQAALLNPLVERNLLSSDGSVMAINLYFDADDYQRGFDEHVATALDKAIAPLQQRLRTVFHLGDPSVRSGISEQIQADQEMILPIALLVLITTLGLILKRVNAALIPLCTAGLSVIWTLGLMAALNIPVNVMTSIIPALLIIVGSTEDIHLLSEYQTGIQKGRRNMNAISFMAEHMGTAIALTFITTFLGFLSISLNRIDLLQQFGMVTAIGLALNFLITITLAPVCLQLMKPYVSAKPLSVGSSFMALTSRVHDLIFRFPRAITTAVVVLMAVCLYWSTQIKVNNNILDYFDPSSKLHQQAESLHKNLSGMQTLSLVVSGTEGTFLQVPYLEELRGLQDYLAETGIFDKSFSFADFIGVVHSGIDGQWPGAIYLPVRSEVVREYMSLLDRDNVKSLVSADYSQARIIVRHSINSSSTLNEAVESIKQYTRQWMDPTLNMTVTGESYLNSQAVDYMADGQARSLFLMLLVIFLLVALLFMNLKAGLVAVIANLFPIVVLFGVMGFFGIALDTGTTMVGAIAMGICVDHTMHFMVRYQHLAKNGVSEEEALGQVIQQESTPIIATTLALAAGFATLTFSNFPPVAMFGLLSALVMLLALVGTFVVIPLILRNTRLITVWDVLSLDLRNEVLESCPLFNGMRPWQVQKLVVLSQIRNFVPDEAIFMQGEKSNVMLVMLEGKAKAWRTRRDGSTYETGTYQPGGVFGITSLVAGKERLADVVAVDKVRVLILRWKSIHNIAKIYPRISSRLYENLSSIICTKVFNADTESKQYIDELSGLYNASFLHEMLTFITDKANRYDEPLCLAILSVNGEGAIAAEYGRQALRWVLREVAQTVTKELRKMDLFARWRSGEFFLMLPKTDKITVREILRRIDMALKQADFGIVPEVNLQARWACLKDGETAENFIARTKIQYVRISVGKNGPVRGEKATSCPCIAPRNTTGDHAERV